MSKKRLFIFLMMMGSVAQAAVLPQGFVYLKNIDSSIIQEIRYAGDHNFIGKPIKGYEASECILTKQAALALRDVQSELKKSNLSLKVYDCYRPQMAVDEFIQWSKMPAENTMKAEFYPMVDKKNVFKLGYVGEKSGHSRGSTIDLTIIALPVQPQEQYHKGQKLVACFAPYKTRFKDNSIDMGTGYDCFDTIAHGDDKSIDLVPYHNRNLLLAVMEKYHFERYPEEWWHFTLKNEPYPDTYFNFPIQEESTSDCPV